MTWWESSYEIFKHEDSLSFYIRNLEYIFLNETFSFRRFDEYVFQLNGGLSLY